MTVTESLKRWWKKETVDEERFNQNIRLARALLIFVGGSWLVHQFAGISFEEDNDNNNDVGNHIDNYSKDGVGVTAAATEDVSMRAFGLMPVAASVNARAGGFLKGKGDDNGYGRWEQLERLLIELEAKSKQVEFSSDLEQSVSQLRTLLQVHHKTVERERLLQAARAGISLERAWYLNKLRDIENLVVATGGAEGGDVSSTLFARAVRSILYEEDEAFRLILHKI
eukprot:jgi/Chlat1/5502/Chrsp360S00835